MYFSCKRDAYYIIICNNTIAYETKLIVIVSILLKNVET